MAKARRKTAKKRGFQRFEIGLLNKINTAINVSGRVKMLVVDKTATAKYNSD